MHMLPRTLIVSVAVATLLPACATSSRPSSPFLRGKPQVASDTPGALAPLPPLDGYIAQLREAQAAARPATRANLASVEMTDPRLKERLGDLAGAPTPANHVRVAEAYRAAGVLDVADDHLVEALRLNPEDASASDLRARIWRDWGFPGLALPHAYRAAYFAPRSAAARNTLGLVLTAGGQLAAARDAFEHAIRLDPRAAYAWNNLCYVSMVERDLVRAEVDCRQAVALDRTSHVAQANLAWIEARLRATPQGE
jgi:Tfp pilus assembly protein PilF